MPYPIPMDTKRNPPSTVDHHQGQEATDCKYQKEAQLHHAIIPETCIGRLNLRCNLNNRMYNEVMWEYHAPVNHTVVNQH